MKIPFSPPDITEAEIEQVAEALRSGWITTGPKTKELEREVADLCGTNRAVCLNHLRLYLYRKCIGGVSCRGKAGSY